MSHVNRTLSQELKYYTQRSYFFHMWKLIFHMGLAIFTCELSF